MSEIDYTKDSKTVLFEIINYTNNTQLQPSDFDVSGPNPYLGSVYKNVNTAVQLTALAGTGYYGTTEVYYNRMELGAILGTMAFPYNPQVETSLVQLLPKLNEVYGIYLKPEDIIDVAIPAYDPVHPNAPRTIIVSAQSTSYFFQGSCSLTLGNVNVPVVEDDGLARIYYLNVDGLPLPQVKESFISLNSDGTVNANFDFLSNASNITEWTLNRVERLASGVFVFIGSFSLDYLDTGNTLNVLTQTGTLFITSEGFIISGQTAPFYNGTAQKLYDAPGVDGKYVIDASIQPSNSSTLYRFSEQGVIDTSFNPQISYVPSFVRVMKDGRIYTVSDVMTMPDPYNNLRPTNQIRIDRLLVTGELDNAFNTVYIRSSKPAYPVSPILDMLPLLTGGLIILFNPQNGLDNNAPIPVVNGQPIVQQNVVSPTVFTWNPIARLNTDGTTDFTFNSTLAGFNAGFVLSQPQNILQADSDLLISTNNTLTWMTYRTNPVTNFTHQQPIHFDWAGNPLLLGGLDYLDQFKWSSLLDIVRQANGAFLGFGMMQSPTVNGQFSAPYSALARYHADTRVDKVLWRSPGPTGTSNPTVSRVFLDEFQA